MIRQRTVAGSVTVVGLGLHSGDRVSLTLRPGAAGAGIVFRRVDLEPVVELPARVSFVGDTELSTTLVNGCVRVATVEHLLAALAGLGVDNAILDITAAEVPILDGSAEPFVQLIRRAGIVEQALPRQFLCVKREVTVRDGDRSASFFPFAGFKVAFTIDFDHPAFASACAHAEMDFSRDSFVDEVCSARTFGFVGEAAGLHARGLARGGSVDNAILLDAERVLNAGGLRFDDEFVRHKILDAVGDLSLLGCALIGEFRAYKSGHALNTAALRRLLGCADAWELSPAPVRPAAVAFH